MTPRSWHASSHVPGVTWWKMARWPTIRTIRSITLRFHLGRIGQETQQLQVGLVLQQVLEGGAGVVVQPVGVGKLAAGGGDGAPDDLMVSLPAEHLPALLPVCHCGRGPAHLHSRQGDHLTGVLGVRQYHRVEAQPFLRGHNGQRVFTPEPEQVGVGFRAGRQPQQQRQPQPAGHGDAVGGLPLHGEEEGGLDIG